MTGTNTALKPPLSAGPQTDRRDRSPARWHALTIQDALGRLSADPQSGLSDDEAAARAARFGPNKVTEIKATPAWQRFLGQFRSILLYALMAAAAICGILEQWVDMSVILGVVVINAIIGFVQEDRAQRAIDAIRDLLAPSARVVRARRTSTVEATELVPGDVVLLREGDRVPADVRLLACDNLSLEEALLTGESLPVAKSTEPCPAKATVGDQSSMAFAGTFVASGQGRAVVVETGDRTQLGTITRTLEQTAAPTPPLIKHMGVFASRLTLFLFVVSLAMLAFGIFVRGMAVADAFMATVAFAVGAIPEGLPAILTITLAAGVSRMAARRAIIRHLPAVETLAAVTVIGSDKTGTLTKNELTVQEWVTALGTHADGDRLDNPVTEHLVRLSMLCTDSEFRDGSISNLGNPIDNAILQVGSNMGLDPAVIYSDSVRKHIVPFRSDHKFMGVALRDGRFGESLVIKGAPEVVFGLCRSQLGAGGPEPLNQSYWDDRLSELTDGARRVIAVAMAPLPPSPPDAGTILSSAAEFTLVGLLALYDPPRPEAITALATARNAGIGVKLITGDHPGTAKAIAREMGLTDKERIVTGAELENTDEAGLRTLIETSDIFARTTPRHKLRLVEALREAGHTIAMTGDGVNDAPALKAADVGIAMGKRGSDAAKQASVMVLTDDNFATLTAAIEEGRTVFDNLRKAIIYVLPTSIAEGLAILIAVVLGVEMPLTPLQVLWINMITAVALSVPLAFERPESDVMSRPPGHFARGLLSRFLIWRVAFVAMIILGLVFSLFWLSLDAGATVEQARSVAINMLVMSEIVYLFNTRRLFSSSLGLSILTENRIALGGALGLLAVQGLFTYTPVFQSLFGTAALDAQTWAVILACALALFAVIEVEKAVLRQNHRNERERSKNSANSHRRGDQ